VSQKAIRGEGWIREPVTLPHPGLLHPQRAEPGWSLGWESRFIVTSEVSLLKYIYYPVCWGLLKIVLKRKNCFYSGNKTREWERSGSSQTQEVSVILSPLLWLSGRGRPAPWVSSSLIIAGVSILPLWTRHCSSHFLFWLSYFFQQSCDARLKHLVQVWLLHQHFGTQPARAWASWWDWI
jgi:hypothetical protein